LISLLFTAMSSCFATDNNYRLTIFPWYTFTNHITVFAQLGSTLNPDQDTRVSQLISPGAYYTPTSWLQLWAGFNNRYTRNAHASDELELRPFGGFKVFLPNEWNLHIYNFTRYEYRAMGDLDTDDWETKSRLRSRFGVEFPLTVGPRAWKPKTLYGLTTVEPFFRLDHNQVDPLRVTGGLGYIFNDRIHLEFQYSAQFTRPGAASLEYTGNTFRLNLKIDLSDKPDPHAPTPSL
jgi:hypothetical protein